VRVSQTAIKRRVICAPIANAFFVADLSQIAPGMYCDFDAVPVFLLVSVGHHGDQDRAVLDGVKALAALDPTGCGLDAACAQLERSTYVMPTKLDLISALTGCTSSRIVKISSMPPGIPPPSRRTRSAEADALRATLPAPFNNQ
jgi:hypothetical protein